MLTLTILMPLQAQVSLKASACTNPGRASGYLCQMNDMKNSGVTRRQQLEDSKYILDSCRGNLQSWIF